MSNEMVIVLGAGKPYRGEAPSAIVQTGQNKRVLDWIIEAFRNSMGAEFHFVGSYRLDERMEKYPDIYFSANPSWEKSRKVDELERLFIDRNLWHKIIIQAREEYLYIFCRSMEVASRKILGIADGQCNE